MHIKDTKLKFVGELTKLIHQLSIKAAEEIRCVFDDI